MTDEAAEGSGSASEAAGSADTSRGRGGSLERSLGLGEALTIGLGTMIGAGIFVFPGLAVAEAGPAAVLSFVAGAGIALLVALPTSELATAMPRSGGGYTFVSRAFGPLPGTLVGIGQWLGLVFASSFYLVGFGHYAVDLAARVGVGLPLGAKGLAFLVALTLTAVALVGTRSSGRLQDWIVGILLVLLTVLLGYGALRILGLGEATPGLGPFAPGGALPVLTTAALVFTSYLGFAQVATMAGEVRRPGWTLPRAMVGGVVLVAALYAGTILVAVGVLGPERMAEAGETAVAELGRALLGAPGALVAGSAGLLATLSSANASILSSSRSVFALSRDGVLPEAAARVNRTFRTPHVSLLLAGLPIAGLTLFGQLEVLAEVASILHLVMYGLMALGVVALRRRDPWWYRPTFETPGYPVLPVAGGVLAFGLVAFMGTTALLLAGGTLAAAGLWHLVYGRRGAIQPAGSLYPSPPGPPVSLLVQVEVPDPPGVPEAVVRALDPERLLLLGWTGVPEQATPEQVRDELGDDARDAVDHLAEALGRLGVEVETELVFTPDRVETVERLAEEREVDAILSFRPVERIGSVLVSVAGEELQEGLARYTARVARAARARVRILTTPELSERPELGRRMRRRLRDLGVPGRRIDVAAAEAEDRADAMLDAVEGSELILTHGGEPVEEDAERVYGEVNARVAEEAEVPLLVIRAGATEGGG